MDNYRIEQEGHQITVWDDRYGVGLRFTEGESLQLYQSAIILANPSLSDDEAGMSIIRECEKKLTAYSSDRWKKEFKVLK